MFAQETSIGQSAMAPNPDASQQGFTLVEIAIVLVIVGLLLGAVLKGQELIFNTKIKSTYNLSREVSAALFAYQDRYRALPGDDFRATSRFPNAVPPVVNGNGNGLISKHTNCTESATPDYKSESCSAVQQMREAEFIAGSGPLALRTAFNGIAWPSTKAYVITGAGNELVLAYQREGMAMKIASAIDSSFDDGNPSTGSFECSDLNEYNMQNPDSLPIRYCAALL